MRKKIGYIVTLLPVVAVLASIGNQSLNKHRIVAAVNFWQSRLSRAHLIEANQATVFAYLKSNGLKPENTGGMFDYDQPPSQVKVIGVNQFGVNQLGSTYQAIVFHVAYTFEPLPLDWMIDLNFQFDRHGKLLFFKVEPDASGI